MPRKLKLTEVFNYLAEETNLSKDEVKRLFNELFLLAVEEINRTGVFIIPQFGKMTITKRSERMGRNPATGKVIRIPAKSALRFKLSKAIKDIIAGSGDPEAIEFPSVPDEPGDTEFGTDNDSASPAGDSTNEPDEFR